MLLQDISLCICVLLRLERLINVDLHLEGEVADCCTGILTTTTRKWLFWWKTQPITVGTQVASCATPQAVALPPGTLAENFMLAGNHRFLFDFPAIHDLVSSFPSLSLPFAHPHDTSLPQLIALIVTRFSAMDVDTTATDSIFFDLPPEVRLEIYNLYMDWEIRSEHFMFYSRSYLTDLASSRNYRASPPPALARTCKRIYLEMVPLFQNLFAIDVMPGLGIGMGGYSRPSAPEPRSVLNLCDTVDMFDGGGLVLTHLTKCIVRVNDPTVEALDSLADFFAQVISNPTRERMKRVLWSPVEYPSFQQARWRSIMLIERGLSGRNQLPALVFDLPTSVYNSRTGWMRGMGPIPNNGPSTTNGLGCAAEGVRELVFEWAPIESYAWGGFRPEQLTEQRTDLTDSIVKRFWDLVAGMNSLEVVRLRGCPGWWKEYLEQKMGQKIMEKKFRIVVAS
ncbi:hypothetical protein V8F20_004753 [Naviculisporaceae sp. PSN 640]